MNKEDDAKLSDWRGPQTIVVSEHLRTLCIEGVRGYGLDLLPHALLGLGIQVVRSNPGWPTVSSLGSSMLGKGAVYFSSWRSTFCPVAASADASTSR